MYLHVRGCQKNDWQRLNSYPRTSIYEKIIYPIGIVNVHDSNIRNDAIRSENFVPMQ